MTDQPTAFDDPRGPTSDGDRRRAPRLPLPGVLVTLVSPDGEQALFATDALDISAFGLAVVLPEDVNGCLAPGDGVLLSFRLDDATAIARLPGRLVRREEGVAAVELGALEHTEHRRLAEWLASAGAAA